jgi:hypothetical protein
MSREEVSLREERYRDGQRSIGSYVHAMTEVTAYFWLEFEKWI